ncbi:GtrA family protein [Paenibacillus tengchongensis]|uniref:GtrA family protein n=1 Tax=Paenibacillus tengchongensis TaxID=2608684 RepID=UPI001651CC76|nr:GtrA family protein [Paenibacillus tengchongensis]
MRKYVQQKADDLAKMSQSVRFIFVGILNTIVGFFAYAAYIFVLNDSYIQALIFSHIVGVIHSYLWNNKWTFQQKSYNGKSIVKFVSVYIVTFFVNLLVLSILVDTIEINKLISQGLALFITTIFSFVGHKYWSFKSTTDEIEEC